MKKLLLVLLAITLTSCDLLDLESDTDIDKQCGCTSQRIIRESYTVGNGQEYVAVKKGPIVAIGCAKPGTTTNGAITTVIRCTGDN